MYSPEGQNKTIPLFLQEKQGNCYSLILFQFFGPLPKSGFSLSIHTRSSCKTCGFFALYLDMYNLVLYMQR